VLVKQVEAALAHCGEPDTHGGPPRQAPLLREPARVLRGRDRAGAPSGNFPEAFTHVALLNAVLMVIEAEHEHRSVRSPSTASRRLGRRPQHCYCTGRPTPRAIVLYVCWREPAGSALRKDRQSVLGTSHGVPEFRERCETVLIGLTPFLARAFERPVAVARPRRLGAWLGSADRPAPCPSSAIRSQPGSWRTASGRGQGRPSRWGRQDDRAVPRSRRTRQARPAHSTSSACWCFLLPRWRNTPDAHDHRGHRTSQSTARRCRR
jgi:hypothetical protein